MLGPTIHQPDVVETARGVEGPKPSTKSGQERLTVSLPAGLLDRVRNAVFWTPRLTLAGLLKMALEDAIMKLEHQHGGLFPHRMEELKGGRPRKARPDPTQWG